MEMRQLRFFLAVAEELHFTRAAQRLHVSQPPLSQQIAKLEGELGVRLLRRTSRRVELTPEGQYFADMARGFLEQLDAAKDHLRRMAQGKAGQVRIGFVGVSMEGPLPDAIQEFRRDVPDVTVSLHQMGTDEQLDTLRAGRIDLACIRPFARVLDGLEHLTLLRQPSVLAVPRDHPLARRRAAPLSALAGIPLIMFPRRVQPQLYDAFMACLAEAGVTPQVVQEVIGHEAALALVAAGLGAALTPASTRTLRPDAVTCLPVVGRLPDLEVTAVWRRTGASPALLRFVETLARQSCLPTR